MREIVFYSKNARTSGNIRDLMQAGRMDIVCHVVIHSLFLSHKIRDTVLHLCFDGQPDPPKHLEIRAGEKTREFLSKKDVSGLIKRMLYKYKKGIKNEVFPSCFIEKKPFIDVVKELSKNKKIYLLDKNGENIRDADIKENSVFVIGDHEGLPKEQLEELKEIAEAISLGKEVYFTSQTIVILNHELDMKNLS